ncbi:hypothetical protein [Nannocystis pusilla]|uniref:hypothetical protein n=1 Tax=Nannocystis pusilla TaxID=889268 RepID=UPI003B799AA9
MSLSLAACFAPVLEIVAGIVQQGTAAGLFRPVADVQRLVERMVGVVHAADARWPRARRSRWSRPRRRSSCSGAARAG